MQQQQTQIDEGLIRAQNDLIQNLADENDINVMEFDGILQPIIDSCTKDSISAGNLRLIFLIDFLCNKYFLKYTYTLNKANDVVCS